VELSGSIFVDVFVTVLVIMDPVGTSPIFVALTRHQTLPERNRSALQAAGVAAAVILVFALFGEQLLEVLGIELQALQVAGGLLLLVIAVELFRGDDDEAMKATGSNVALVPLGTPLLAGPGAIAATMLAMRSSDTTGERLSVVLALLTALFVVYLGLRFSGLLHRVLKENGIHLVSRILGLLVAAIGIQLIAAAVEEWVRTGVG
jgi:multiple antibiotic resistance protein